MLTWFLCSGSLLLQNSRVGNTDAPKPMSRCVSEESVPVTPNGVLLDLSVNFAPVPQTSPLMATRPYSLNVAPVVEQLISL